MPRIGPGYRVIAIATLTPTCTALASSNHQPNQPASESARHIPELASSLSLYNHNSAITSGSPSLLSVFPRKTKPKGCLPASNLPTPLTNKSNMGNICSRSSNEPEAFAGPGRVVGASPAGQSSAPRASVPAKANWQSSPGRTLGESSPQQGGGDEARSNAAIAAQVSWAPRN